MSTPFNRYGMPSGRYAQMASRQGQTPPDADPNPIANALAGKPARATADGTPPNTVTPVLATGQPNLHYTALNNALTAGDPTAPPDPAPPPPAAQPPAPPMTNSVPVPPVPVAVPRAQTATNYQVPTTAPMPRVTPTPLYGNGSNGDFDATDAATIISNAYKKYLKRAPSEKEIFDQLHGIGWSSGQYNELTGVVGAKGLNAIIGWIANSPEALALLPAATTTPTGGVPTGNTAPAGYYSNVPAIDPHVNQLTQDYINQNHLTANQSDPAALAQIVNYLKGQNVNAQVDYTDQNGHTGGIVVNGRPYQLIDGSNHWTNLQAWPEASSPAASATRTPLSNSVMNALMGGMNMPPDASQQLLQQILQNLALNNALFQH